MVAISLALPALALGARADLTTCQSDCVAQYLCAGVTDYLDSSCICSDDFQQNVKGCLYAASSCANDVPTWFDYAESACAAASSGSSGSSGSTASATETAAADSTAQADSSSGSATGSHTGSRSSATGSASASATSEAKAAASSTAASSGALGAKVPAALGALGIAAGLLL
ncbi:uncharacterized protein EHS24_008114 [Apiotrichum porosum]|uniref:CFEM domain-containing protein n=1 Tax=Apiotrichum porosum TaxID=105984 RepID=A0A427XSX3_9TREE|nr:uncharacterized protein EHS24_008114 [Apiotrichum porosum]RSH81917.1 hypothetical protein EHS24_008114 [Apiotrichum porosum]